MRRKSIFTIALLILSSLFSLTFAEAAENKSYIVTPIDQSYVAQKANNNKSAINNPVLIRLSHTHFDPLQKIPGPRNGLKKINAYKPSTVGYYIIQFDGPIQKSWKGLLKGNKVGCYISGNKKSYG
jgi:hypothetical protein